MIETYLTNLRTITFLGNNGYDIASGIVFFVLFLLVVARFKQRCHKSLKSLVGMSETGIDDLILKILCNSPWYFYTVLGLYGGSLFLDIQPRLQSIIYIIFVILGLREIGIGISRVVLKLLDEKYLHGSDSKHTLSFLRIVMNIVIRSVVTLMVLNNIGVQITPLITSLGIVGIAVAFALQNILEDVFSSISIFLDKPFRIGDYIEIEQYSGTVSYVGIKTTRIITIRGEELVIANRKLTGYTIRNYGKMDHRTATVIFTIPYETEHSKISSIPSLFKGLMQPIEGVTLQYINLTNLAESGIEFTYRYTLNSKDYQIYLDTQQHIHLEHLRVFEENKIGLAYPTQTINLIK